MRLLQYAKPLTLIESGDWGCRVQFPETIHSVWRNGYGAGGVMEHASYLPFGIEYNDTAGFVAATAAARHFPVPERDVAVSFAGSISMRNVYHEDTHTHARGASGSIVPPSLSPRRVTTDAPLRSIATSPCASSSTARSTATACCASSTPSSPPRGPPAPRRSRS